MPDKRKLRRTLRRNIQLLMLNELCAELRFLFPVAVLGFQYVTGSFTLAMSVFGFASLCQAFLEIPTGVLSDKWGRRKTFLIGTLGEFSAILCYALAFTSPTPLLWLYGGSFCYGFANALFSGNNTALIYETLEFYKKSHELSKVMGRISAMGQIGLGTAGVTSAALLWMGFGYQTLLFLTLVPLSTNVMTAFWTVEPPSHLIEEEKTGHIHHMMKSAKLIWKNKKLLLVAIASIISIGGGQANYYFAPSFVSSVWPVWMTSLYRLGQHTIGATSFWFAGPVIKALGKIKAIIGSIVFGNSFYFLALALSNALSPILMLITQSTYAVYATADKALQQENFSAAQRSTMGSIISLFAAITTALSSLFLGWLGDITSPVWAIGIFMVMRSCVTLPIYGTVYRKERG